MNKFSKYLAITACVSVILAANSAALEINGYYENDISGFLKNDGSLLGADFNRLRLKFDSRIGKFALHIEPRYYFYLKTKDFPLAGISDLNQVILDKFYLKAYLRSFDITAGKQRIAWGTGYIWNPVDIFNPFVLSFAVKNEEETNVQAVRVEIPLGTASGIDSFVLTDNQWEKTKKGIRTKTNVGLFDLALSYVDLATDGYQWGFDTAGEALGIGVRGEISLKNNTSTQAVLGWDYTLENGTGLAMEYFYNSFGRKNINEYNWAALYAGQIKELGRDYLYFGVNKIIDELTNIRGSLIMNLNDGSFLIYPAYTRNIQQNVDLSFEAMLLGGQVGSEFYPPTTWDPNGFGGSKLALVRIICNF